MPTNRPTSSYCLLCDDAAPVFIGFGSMMTIGDTPHQWLFPRVAAVAYHCGAGTTAAGLRAGVPTIALPAHADGPFWAARLTALDDPQLRDNARRLGADVAAENVVAQVVSTVESLLGGSHQ